MDKSAQSRLLALSGAMGFMMYGLGYTVPLVRKDLGISRALASVHQITYATLLLVSSLFLSRIIAKYSPTAVMRAGWLVAVGGISIYAISPTIWLTVPAYGFSAIGATLFANTMSATLGQVKGSSLKLMLRATGISTGAGAVAPLSIGFLVGRDISWRLVLLVITLVVGLTAFRSVPNVADRTPVHTKSRTAYDRAFQLTMGLGFATNFLEVAAGAWALDLFIQRGLTRNLALIMATSLSFGISAARLSFSYRTAWGELRIWLFSAVLSFIGLAMIVSTSNGAMSVIGLIVASVGIGPLGAIAISYASNIPHGADHGVAANVMGASVALGVGPWLIGYVSDKSSFSYAYAIPTAMVIVATSIFLSVRRETAKK